MKKMNKKLIKSIFARAISRKGVTIVCNTGNGKFVKLPTECWNVIEKYIDNYSPQEICDASEPEDRDYYKNIFEKLLEKELLVLPGEEYIREVDLILTNRCNLKCIHCCADADESQGTDSLSTKDWFQIIDILEINQIENIAITGGEPMLRKDFFEIINYLKKNFSGTLSLATNGTFICERNVGLLAQTFEVINISVDGYDESTCSQIRGTGVFDKVINGVKLLKSVGFDSAKITLSMVETTITVGKIDLFNKLCEELGVKPIIREFSATGRAANQKWLQIAKENKAHGAVYLEEEKMLDYINIDHVPCQNCTAGRTRLAIDSRGNVYPCLVLVEQKYCFGNILSEEKIIERIWNHFGNNTDNNTDNRFGEFDSLLIENNKQCTKCDVAPFCHMCLDSFRRQEEKEGLSQICNNNKEFLERIIWSKELMN